MGGSVPQPAPIFNPSPVQSSGGFNIPTPMPTSLGAPMELSAPVEVPVFAKETPIVIGGEQLPMPVMEPVKEIAPIPVREKQPIIVPIKPPIIEDKPIVMPSPPPAQPISIISTKPPLTIDKSDSKFILPPPSVPSDMKGTASMKSTASMISELSKETGITSKKVADFLFPKKEKPKPNLFKEIADTYVPPESVASSAMSVPTSIPTSTTKADYLFLDDRSIPDDKSISSMSGFNPPSEKSSIKKKPIIAEPKETVVIKKPELKRTNPYDIFSEAERSLPPNVIQSEDEASLAIIPKMVSGKKIPSDNKPPKKRVVVESDEELNIIPADVSAGRRMPAIPERTGNYQSKAELVSIAELRGIDLKKMNGKTKTRKDLYIDIYGR